MNSQHDSPKSGKSQNYAGVDSDNYFDLGAGEERTITLVKLARALTPEQVSVAWR